MYCKYCGSKNDSDALFCSQCGAKKDSSDSDSGSVKLEKESKRSRKVVYQGEIHKCTSCGETLQSFESICPSCGNEIRSSKASGTFVEFTEKLRALEKKKSIRKTKGLKDILGLGNNEIEDFDRQIIDLIKNYVVPNNFEDLSEFLILSTSNINVKLFTSDNPEDFGLETELDLDKLKIINDAWISKSEQVYQKLKITANRHPKFSNIESIYLDKVNKINKIKEKAKNKKRTIILISAFTLLLMVIAGVIVIPILLNMDERTLKMPASVDYYINRNFEEVILELEDLGFINIVYNELELLSINTTNTHGQVVELSINGNKHFETNSEFSNKTTVEVTYYVTKYTISMNIYFESNIIFDKYDVYLLVNGERKGIIYHGKSESFTFRIRAGQNEITFVNVDDSKVKGTINIIVEGDMQVAYNISSNSNNVTIKNRTEPISISYTYSILLD